MKNGTFYGARLKKAYAEFRSTAAEPEIPEADDPLTCLAVAILGVGTTEQVARQAVERTLSAMVDWNEIRVSRPLEVHKALGEAIPDGLKRAGRLVDALQSVFDRENRISLDRLHHIGRREARHYLETLRGVDEFAAASVFLWSLGGHAIPVDDRLLKALRRDDLVHPEANRQEVQAFLERHVSAVSAKEFCLVMRSFPGRRHGFGRRSHRE